MRTNLLLLFCAPVLALASTSLAHARDSAERMATDATSRRMGLGRNQISLLERRVGPGNSSVLDALVSTPTGSRLMHSASKRLTSDSEDRATGPGWYLSIRAGGSSGEFYRTINRQGVDVSQRWADKALIAKATEFVEAHLARTLRLKPAEMYPLTVRHQIQESGSKGSSVSSVRQVISSEVTFGRKVGGIPVLGPGSKIAVELSVTGEVLTYRFDWPSLSVGMSVQNVVAPEIVSRRAATHAGMSPDLGDYQRFECGYYDAGTIEGGSVLQGACLIQQVERGSDGAIVKAVEEFIPAGATVISDKKWIAATRVAGDLPTSSDPLPPAGPSRH